MKNIKNLDGINGQNLKFPTKKENPDEKEKVRCSVDRICA